MSETKQFPTEDVLSTITGYLIGKIDGVYQVLNWMTGEAVFTHQLPRIGREACPLVVAMHPHLQSAIDEAPQITHENWQAFRNLWIDRYGPVIAVPKFTSATHERIDPLSELAEKVHPDKIIVIKSSEAGR